MEAVVVTRHAALVEYIGEIGLLPEGAEVVAHATTETVRGKHVIGVLPLHLAAEAKMVTEIPLALTAEMRGRELTLEEVRAIAGKPRHYIVREITE